MVFSLSLTTTCSDHPPELLLAPGFYRYKNVTKSNVLIQEWKTFNNDAFSADFKSTDWPNIIQSDKGNPNLSFRNYFEEFEKKISSHAPLKKLEKENLNFRANTELLLVYKSL